MNIKLTKKEYSQHRAYDKAHKTRRIPIVSAGFTILETLVAISILVLALTAPLVIVSQALKSSYFSRDQITAYYLAQEAVEYLRNKRDNQGLAADASADNWIMNFTDDSGSMINDANSTTIKSYLVRDSQLGYQLKRCNGSGGSSSPCPNVKYNPNAFDPGSDSVLYGDTSATDDSIFIREITVSKPPAGTLNNGTVVETNDPSLREVIVTVKVIWRMQDGSYSSGVTLREHLTNWQLEKDQPITP